MKEFDLINNLLKPIAGKDSAALGDDCAFFGGYAITKDILVAGVHFFAGDAPFNLARKAIRVNFSDLASSGAKPFGIMLALAIPRGTESTWLEEFTKGLKSDLTEFSAQLLGGDTVFHDGALTISITAIGKVEKPIQRNGAKEGQNIFVTGTIGKGWLGLQSKKAGVDDEFSAHYELPTPRLDMLELISKYATSCIDISDGLLAETAHICQASGLGAELEGNKIPLASKQADLISQITGGDDYELLFTSYENEIENCHKIGRMVAGEGIKLDGVLVAAKGFEHK